MHLSTHSQNPLVLVLGFSEFQLLPNFCQDTRNLPLHNVQSPTTHQTHTDYPFHASVNLKKQEKLLKESLKMKIYD